MNTTYDLYREQAKTGDVLLFDGKGLVSGLVKFAQLSDWSHVGMVVKSHEMDMLLCWESTTLSKIKDVDAGIVKSGVMIVPLSMHMAKYDGRIAVRQLRTALVDTQRRILMQMRREVRDVPYEQNLFELLKSTYDGPFGKNTADLSSIFCSELIAEYFIRIKLLTDELPANEYTPKDFAGKEMDHILCPIMMLKG